MRRKTTLVKRENKLRNAILAGDTKFSYATARAAEATAGSPKMKPTVAKTNGGGTSKASEPAQTKRKSEGAKRAGAKKAKSGTSSATGAFPYNR